MNPSHKLASFDGLRGVAAFVVVIHHLRLAFWADAGPAFGVNLSAWPQILQRPVLALILGLSDGTFAVWLFWIMSAFVLSLQFFLRAQEGPLTRAHDYLEDACLRRYPRLLIPVLVSVVIAYGLHAAHLMQNLAVAEVWKSPSASGWLTAWYTFPPSPWGAFKSGVWQSFFTYDQATSYNGVLWTMEKEFYGSLFLFAFLAVLGHRRTRFWAYPMVALVCRQLGMSWLNAFVGGIALCDVFVNHRHLPRLQVLLDHPVFRPLHRPLVAGLVWLVLLAGVGLAKNDGETYLLLGIGAVALTLASGCTQRWLSHAIPQYLGRISFGMYLIHTPLICSFSCWAYLALLPRMGHLNAALLSSAATCVLSILGGHLLYVIADRPAIQASRWISAFIRNGPSAK
jgi:peptidoglycan/LPS O-acetylase OafA/YrhL